MVNFAYLRWNGTRRYVCDIESEQISKTKEESGGERRMREAAVTGSKVTAGE